MLVVFLGYFNTPTPEGVTRETSELGASGTVILPSGSSGPPLINFIYLQHIIKKVDKCKFVSSPVFLS